MASISVWRVLRDCSWEQESLEHAAPLDAPMGASNDDDAAAVICPFALGVGALDIFSRFREPSWLAIVTSSPLG